MKDIYDENYIALKKLKKTLEDGKTSNVSRLRKLILLKMAYYQKQSTNPVHPNQNTDIFHRTIKSNQNIIGVIKTSSIQTILRERKTEQNSMINKGTTILTSKYPTAPY